MVLPSISHTPDARLRTDLDTSATGTRILFGLACLGTYHIVLLVLYERCSIPNGLLLNFYILDAYRTSEAS